MIPTLLLLVAAASATPAAGIGYPSVAKAWEQESVRKGATVSVQPNGWMAVANPKTHTLWSFAPTGDPAYPTAVRRVIGEKKGALQVQMDILCGATKSACDEMNQAFETLNARMAQEFRAQHQR